MAHCVLVARTMVIATDLRLAVRRLLAVPSFTIVAVLTLALGIGATTAIYSVVDALMLRPLPYADPDRLADIGTVGADSSTSAYVMPSDLPALKQRTDLFASVDAFIYGSATIFGGDEPVLGAGAVVGADLMRTLAVTPLLGRYITETDTRPGAANVVVLSEEAWRRRFAADRSIVGRTIRLDNRNVEVIGVMPPAFKFPDGRRDFWVPFVAAASDGRPMQVVARLPSDVPIAAARARVDASAIERTGDTPVRLKALPALSRQLNPPVRAAIYILIGAVVCVLLIACANIANLLLVQNAGRDREVAVRAALGASQWRLARQFLTEAMVLSFVGGAAGFLVAQWAIALLHALAPAEMTFLSVNEISLDRRVALFALALTTIAGCLCGVLPAVKRSREAPHDALKAGTRSATGTAAQEWLRRAFVVGQLAVSVVLLVGASLLTRTLIGLIQVDPGFNPRNLAVVGLQLPRWKYPDNQARRAFYDAVTERVRALPGVTGATVNGGAPPDSGGFRIGPSIEIEGRGVVVNDPKLLVPFSSIRTEYFNVMGVPIKAGRTFDDEDVQGAAPTIVINERMADRVWQGANPLGQRIKIGSGPSNPWYTVVGIVGDVYQLDYAETKGVPTYYLSVSQTGVPANQTLVVRTFGDPGRVLPLLKEAIRAVDPDQPILKIGTMDERYAAFFALPRFYTALLGLFALLGVVIAAVGLYGVLAYAIASRTRELGIRLALGAQRSSVWWLVLRHGALVTSLGLAVGIAGSFALTRSLNSMLIGVPRIDPVSYSAVIALLGAIAFAACWIPARRATQVDPVVALRAE